ncbi:MAG: hypothetical protein HRU03_04870 [Nanoarchaeales archaeon]|nr:hypothetical protein [Nanoarchaeales archaeon]
MSNTLVFDMCGIIYSYDNNNQIDNKTIDLEDNQTQRDTIQSAIKANSNQLGVFEMPNAIDKLFSHIKLGDKIVIISSSSKSTSKLILETFFKNRNLDTNLINNIDIYCSSDYGSKSDTQTWHDILKNENYENITEMYEDTKEYLDAAQYAIKKLGNSNCKFSQKI